MEYSPNLRYTMRLWQCSRPQSGRLMCTGQTTDAKLQVGQITETVSVTAEGVPLLETETAHLGAQFGHSYMASLAYAGSHGYNLEFPTDINQITNPSFLAASAAAGSAIQTDRPFPYWGNLTGFHYNAISNYNALQATINKHFSNGLLFSFNYVWSHFLDEMDSSGWGNRGGTQTWQVGNHPGLNYGNSNFDIPNAFKGYASYELPFGKGKEYLNGTSRWMDELVGGWRIAGTFIAQSGNPFTVVNNTNQNSKISGCAMNCNWYPNVIADTHVSNPSPAGWFNTAAFANASTGNRFALGDEVRNSLRGPRSSVLNLSLAKDFSFGERVHLELRSDWVNALNHLSFNTPGLNFGGSNFGLINPATQGGGIAVAPRSGQLSARVTF